jgi:hypothetical protein
MILLTLFTASDNDMGNQFIAALVSMTPVLNL